MLKPLTVIAALALLSWPALAAGTAAFDPDKDGTIDLNEAKAAAAATFDKLDVDHEGTLDAKELHGRIARADWPKADPDTDKTISKEEYLAYVETLFKQADKDSEGTIDAKELRSPAGSKLVKLLK